MKIKYKTFKQGSTFGAVLICEYCNFEEKIKSGSTSNNWMKNTLPKLCCSSCGKDRKGNKTERIFQGSFNP